MSHFHIKRLWHYFWLLVLLVAVAITYGIYKQGLNGPFVFDDGINIVGNETLRIDAITATNLEAAAFSIPNGLFRRPLSMVSFALNCYFDNCANSPFPNPYIFKLTNLIIHLLNGVLIAILVRQITGRLSPQNTPDAKIKYADYFPVAVAAAWLLHPFALTGVLYVVQRMTSLSSMFCLAGMVAYLYGRQRMLLGLKHGKWAVLSTALLFTPLSVFAKETGLLMPIYILLIEIFFFKFEVKKGKSSFVVVFILLYSILPVVIGIGYFGIHMSSILSGYNQREFDVWERLLTEARVFWFYISQIIAPNIAAMGMFHDDFSISRNLHDPIETLYSLVGVGALFWMIWIWRIKHAFISFGFLFYIVGQSMESTFIPLELIHEHRNYLPMVGILLAVLHSILGLEWGAHLMVLRRSFVCLIIGLFSAVTYARVQEWASAETLWQAETMHHPESLRASLAQGDYYANALSFDPLTKILQISQAEQWYQRALEIDPKDVSAQLGLLKLHASNGNLIQSDALEAAIKSIATQLLPANVNDKLIALARCAAETDCALKTGDVNKLIQAALKNTKLTANGKALIYSADIYFQAKVEKDLDRAMQSARAAIAIDPDLSFQLWVVSIYIDMNKPQEARDQLALIERLDVRKTKARDLVQLNADLAQRVGVHN